jgi:TPR repeat protein
MIENGWLGRSAADGMVALGIETSDLFVAQRLAEATEGDHAAYYELGVAYSTGRHGIGCDLIEAHKWFNLAAVGGHEEAQFCRAEISAEMTAREIAEAQRRARQWLSDTSRKAA